MPRVPLRLDVADISAFARSLRNQIVRLDHAPGHVELLNMVCRSAGYRNYQHFHAEADAATVAPDEAPPPSPAAAVDPARIAKAARYFDGEGRMLQWPAKTNLQHLCLWVLWTKLPAGTVFNERGISAVIAGWHHFGDHALLRRELCDYRLVARTPDGREYRRIEQEPPAELAPLLEAIGVAEAA